MLNFQPQTHRETWMTNQHRVCPWPASARFRSRSASPGFRSGVPRSADPNELNFGPLIRYWPWRIGDQTVLCHFSSLISKTWSSVANRDFECLLSGLLHTLAMAIDFSWRILQVVILSCLFSLASSLSTISVVGSKFYDNDGNQFFVKGMPA